MTCSAARASASAPGRRHAPLLFLGPFAVVFLAFFVVPIGYAVWQSFTGVRRSGTLGLGGGETTFAGLRNYSDALTQTAFTESLLRILLFGAVVVPLMIGAAVALALLLDSASAVWPRFFRTVYFLPYGVVGRAARRWAVSAGFTRDRRRAGTRRAAGRRGATERVGIGTRVLVVAILAIVAGYFLVPIYWVVVASTKTTDQLLGSSPLWFAQPRPWRNLTELLTYDNGIYLRWLGNTVLYSGVGALAATLLAAGAGHAMATYTFRGREAAFNVAIGGALVSVVPLAIAIFILQRFWRTGLTEGSVKA